MDLTHIYLKSSRDESKAVTRSRCLTSVTKRLCLLGLLFSLLVSFSGRVRQPQNGQRW